MDDKKIRIEIEQEGKTPLLLDIVKPSNEVLQHSQIIYSSAWQRAVNNNPPLMLRQKLNKVLRDQGLWDDKKDEEERNLVSKIREAQYKLEKGGIKLQVARQLALDTLTARNQLKRLLAERNRIDGNTAEAHADNAQFNYLVSQCTLDAKLGTHHFNSLEDYEMRATEPASVKAAETLMRILYDVDAKEDFETEFLKKYNFMDSDGWLLKDGKKISYDGRPVNDKGQYVNENGEAIDENGHLIDENGKYVVEHLPFLDEEGNSLDD